MYPCSAKAPFFAAWARRPRAAALAAALAHSGRAWDAIVVGEYERAFYGARPCARG
jgi:hypothetical protein